MQEYSRGKIRSELRIRRLRKRIVRVIPAILFSTLIVVIVFALYIKFAHAQEIVYIAPEEKVERVLALVTAYTSSVDETDDTPFETASGSRARQGVVACPSKYPFGTVVEISGVEYICEDRMGKRFRNDERFDVWHESKEAAFAWGVQTLQVVVR